jgi:ATP-binding cassette subfamily F protein 3
MTLLSAENVTKQFGDRVLFDDLCFSVGEYDRVGLVGPNGIGKTTLFDIMAGRIRPDKGRIIKSKDCVLAYVEQEFREVEHLKLLDYVASARPDLIEYGDEIQKTERALHDNPESEYLLGRLGDLQSRFENAGGYDFEAELKIILVGLGFTENRFTNRLRDFSGGEKNRAALARVLASRGTLLLLDEPTNHLDIESTVWLEEYLRGLDKAYIIVSHDRVFLNNTIEKVWEISSRKIEQYFNGFENYLRERRERMALLEHRFKHQQEEIERIEEFIRRNIAGQKTKQAQSRMKHLARMKKIEAPRPEQQAPTFSLPSGQRSYNLVLAIEKASFGYGNRALISEADCNLYRGDHIGLIGQNGSGKTTVLKTIIGELEPLGGSVRIGQKVDIAYFDQALAGLDENNIILDELWLLDQSSEAGTLRAFLARFGFRGTDVFKNVAILSGGEKTKLALAKLLFHPANFLILDEPTNHLDMDSRQALEEALLDYSGALLIVSHDRFLLDMVAERIFAIEDGRLNIYDGNYSYYREKWKARAEVPSKKRKSPEKPVEYTEFRKLSQVKGRIKKELRSLKDKIKDNELALERLERDIMYNIPKTDWPRLSEASQQKSVIESLLLELYQRHEEVERLNAEYTDSDRQPD